MQRPATSSLSIRFRRMAGVAGTGFTAVPAVGIVHIDVIGVAGDRIREFPGRHHLLAG